jgi:hypothetical protein
MPGREKMKNIITVVLLALFLIFEGAGSVFLYAQDSGKFTVRG